MKHYTAAAILFATALTCLADNQSIETPLTMEQLMRELRIQGGNFQFTFDQPAFAKVTVITTEYPEGKQIKEEFITATANRRIDLFFSASALFIGDYPRGDQRDNPRKMLIKLSDCKATEGTRVIHFQDKFTENRFGEGMMGVYKPAVPAIPELGKEYILHWYFKKGDPYEAKATIVFSDTAPSK